MTTRTASPNGVGLTSPGPATGSRVAPGSIIVGGTAIGAAILIGVLSAQVSPILAIAGIAGFCLIALIAVHPRFGAYFVIGLTPLVAGIDRGAVIPVLRPSEAVALLAAVGLTVGGLVRNRGTGLTMPRLRTADVSILLLAITSSIVPLLWMLLRGGHPTGDDLLYALTIWKFYAVFVIVRCSIRNTAEVKVCLYIAMVAAGIVAVIAIFQALKLFGVTEFVQRYYSPYGVESEVANNRGGATLSLPVAVADLMVLNIAVAFGLLLRGVPRRQAQFLLGISVLFLMGVLAAGELSGVIALGIGAITLAIVTKRGRYLVRMIPVALLALFSLQPVLHARLADIDPQHGLPVSWVGRLDNLNTFFWPRLFSGFNWVLGVQPSARVATPKFASGWVWIESGYTWLLWAGGIPLLLAYLWFTRENIRVNLRPARLRPDAAGAASLAVVVGLIFVAVCMMLDPHLTYRGSADYLFALMALAAVRDRKPLVSVPSPPNENGSP